MRRELDEARVALRLVEESRTSYKQRYIEAKKAQARESHARESVLEMFRSKYWSPHVWQPRDGRKVEEKPATL